MECREADGGGAPELLRLCVPCGCKAGRSNIFSGDLSDTRRKPCRDLCRQQYDDPLRKPHPVYKYKFPILETAFSGIRQNPVKGRYSENSRRQKVNRKLCRLLDEIQKTEEKIAEYQEYLKELNMRRKQMEDAEIIKSIRSMKLNSREMLSLLENIKNGALAFQDADMEEKAALEKEKMENESRN